MIPDWVKELTVAATVCDINGTIIYMNDKSAKTFAKWGGIELLGKSLFDCHNPNSVAKIKELLTNGGTNAYTIEKEGIKKMIYQTPWYESGKVAGLLELSLEIPFEMPHFVRS